MNVVSYTVYYQIKNKKKLNYKNQGKKMRKRVYNLAYTNTINKKIYIAIFLHQVENNLLQPRL